MSASDEATAIPPALAAEFLVWLWWKSEQDDGAFELGGDAGRVVMWIDDKLAFRHPDETKVTATMSGVNPSRGLAARAALREGKLLHELRVAFRREDREFSFTIRGPGLDVARVKLPQAVDGAGEEALYDRMFLYEELFLVLGSAFRLFAVERQSEAWRSSTLPALAVWARDTQA